MVKIKICGLRTLEDARFAAQTGADMLGFHLSRQSAQAITRDDALAICDTLRQEMSASCPLLIGVFVNELVSNISAATIKIGLNAAQLSGDESDVMLRELRGIGYKAIQPLTTGMAMEDVQYYQPYFPANERLPSLMLDPYSPALKGGDAKRNEMVLAVKDETPRLMLTGGFTPENVATRITALLPWGVDINEGVERAPGVKDRARIKALIGTIRSL